ncbi:hypothetical protein C0991_010061 [Blastosporella zonata]|nr:hypothetical protein C0991_010061 [Blastosporella zonata]
MSETTRPHPLPKAKLTAVSRFKQFAGDRLGIKSEPKIVFPPPSWFITDEPTQSSSEDVPQPLAEPPEELDPPEPTTFALKIRQMIESLPLPASVTAAIGIGHADQGAGPDRTGTAPPVDGRGPPIPDNVDARTMRLLSSENMMNGNDAGTSSHDGSSSGVSYRRSVWSILERMKPGRPEGQATDLPPLAGDSTDTHAAAHHEKGVMMYSPLEPTADSEVEIAESITEYPSEPAAGVDNGKGKAPEPGPPPVMETHWVPSTTKISVLTTWWGYRLYLPPPIMATLDSHQLKATQRAAMITAALSWFLKRVPTLMVPAPMMPTVQVLRRLAPFLSYIGVFIAWSWNRIATCDRGNGVVLTATWLLPVALIPMPWDAGDIYGPRIRPSTPQETLPNFAQPDAASASSSGKEKEAKSKSKGYVRST